MESSLFKQGNMASWTSCFAVGNKYMKLTSMSSINPSIDRYGAYTIRSKSKDWKKVRNYVVFWLLGESKINKIWKWHTLRTIISLFRIIWWSCWIPLPSSSAETWFSSTLQEEYTQVNLSNENRLTWYLIDKMLTESARPWLYIGHYTCSYFYLRLGHTDTYITLHTSMNDFISSEFDWFSTYAWEESKP